MGVTVYGMKRVMSIVLMGMLAMGFAARGQEVEDFVSGLLQQYPQARLLDIYKSCFQDFMGPEHLVNDTASARAYLEQELALTEADKLQPWYWESCGIDGNYVRVSLKAVMEGFISADTLLDAFVHSANDTEHPTVEQWATRWHDIVGIIDDMGLTLPHYDEDKQFIEDVLAQGKYAISHSPDFREAYSPHYRIVKRDIFEQELKPLLPCPCCP